MLLKMKEYLKNITTILAACLVIFIVFCYFTNTAIPPIHHIFLFIIWVYILLIFIKLAVDYESKN